MLGKGFHGMRFGKLHLQIERCTQDIRVIFASKNFEGSGCFACPITGAVCNFTDVISDSYVMHPLPQNVFPYSPAAFLFSGPSL